MRKAMPTAGGDPRLHQSARKLDKRLHQASQRIRITSDRGRIARKRKKHVHLVERAAYRRLIVSVMHDLYERRNR